MNVRLNGEDARRAAALREAGVPISTVVREAIRSAYERRVAVGRRARKPSTIVAAILAEYPDEQDTQARKFDLRDRDAVRREIVKRLSRARR